MAAVVVGALVALAGSLALAPVPSSAGAAPGQLLPGESTTEAPPTSEPPPATDPLPTTEPPATTEPVPTTQDTVAPTTAPPPPVTAAPVAPPTTAQPVLTTAAPVTTTEPAPVTTAVDLLIPGDGTEGAESTTTTLVRDAGASRTDRGLDDSTLVALVIGGLVVLALVVAVLTWRYWAATRPVPAPAGDPAGEEPPDKDGGDEEGGGSRPADPSPDADRGDGSSRNGSDGPGDPSDPVVSSSTR